MNPEKYEDYIENEGKQLFQEMADLFCSKVGDKNNDEIFVMGTFLFPSLLAMFVNSIMNGESKQHQLLSDLKELAWKLIEDYNSKQDLKKSKIN